MEAGRSVVKRARPWSAAVVPLLFAAFMLTACGSSGSQPGVASLGGSPHNGSSAGSTGSGGTVGGGNSSSGGGQVTSSGGGTGGNTAVVLAGGQNSLQFSHCMQTHGVPDFPDPGANGTISFGSSSGVDVNSAAYRSAMGACRKYLGGTGKQTSVADQQKLESDLLEYSACMRANGVPNYPDPQFTGNAVRQNLQGIDPTSPAYLHAQQSCKKYLSGVPGDKTGVGGGPPPPGAGGKQ